MGMRGVLRPLRPDQLVRILDDSDLQRFLTLPSLQDEAERQRMMNSAPEALGAHFAAMPLHGDPRREPALYLDKAWHALHYLLTGLEGEAPPPLGWAIFGAAECGEDLAYGPARLLTRDQVADVSKALQRLPSTLGRNPSFPPSIYLAEANWGTELVVLIEDLKKHYEAAAAERFGMLCWVS